MPTSPLCFAAFGPPGTASAVSGYIEYLPQPGCASFYDAPLHWEDAELAQLQYPPLVQAVYEQREQIRSLHERVRGGGGAQACGMVKVAALVGPYLASTGSSRCIGRRWAALRTREERSDVSDPTEQPCHRSHAAPKPAVSLR